MTIPERHGWSDITPSMGWRREAQKEETLDDLFLKGRERGIDIRTVSKKMLGKLMI